MSFTGSELRLGMDVFSADGVLLGSVVHIRKQPRGDVPRAQSADRTPDGSTFSGESLGPMSTAALGNDGPASQRRDVQYATATRLDSRHTQTEIADIVVLRTMVHLDWRSLMPALRRYPVSLIQYVSLERIVLNVTAAELEGR